MLLTLKARPGAGRLATGVYDATARQLAAIASGSGGGGGGGNGLERHLVAWAGLVQRAGRPGQSFGQLRLDRGYTDAAAGGAHAADERHGRGGVAGPSALGYFVSYWCGAGPRPSTRSTAARSWLPRHGVRAAGGHGRGRGRVVAARGLRGRRPLARGCSLTSTRLPLPNPCPRRPTRPLSPRPAAAGATSSQWATTRYTPCCPATARSISSPTTPTRATRRAISAPPAVRQCQRHRWLLATLRTLWASANATGDAHEHCGTDTGRQAPPLGEFGSKTTAGLWPYFEPPMPLPQSLQRTSQAPPPPQAPALRAPARALSSDCVAGVASTIGWYLTHGTSDCADAWSLAVQDNGPSFDSPPLPSRRRRRGPAAYQACIAAIEAAGAAQGTRHVCTARARRAAAGLVAGLPGCGGGTCRRGWLRSPTAPTAPCVGASPKAWPHAVRADVDGRRRHRRARAPDVCERRPLGFFWYDGSYAGQPKLSRTPRASCDGTSTARTTGRSAARGRTTLLDRQRALPPAPRRGTCAPRGRLISGMGGNYEFTGPDCLFVGGVQRVSQRLNFTVDRRGFALAHDDVVPVASVFLAWSSGGGGNVRGGGSGTGTCDDASGGDQRREGGRSHRQLRAARRAARGAMADASCSCWRGRFRRLCSTYDIA